MKLQVQMAAREDVYRDLARIPEAHRRGRDGKTIIEGSVCKISAGSASTYALLRGCQVTDQPVILLDERTRNELGLSCGQSVDFVIKPAGLSGQFRWAWSASDPAYRIGARMAVISVALGFTGLVLGVVSILLSVKSLGH